MSKKALIFENKVVDIADKEFEVHKSMTWVDATDATEFGGSWDGTSFGPADTRPVVQIAADNLYFFRLQRGVMLAETDYLALSDQTLTDAMKTYRQELRDITKSATSLEDVKWPTKP